MQQEIDCCPSLWHTIVLEHCDCRCLTLIIFRMTHTHTNRTENQTADEHCKIRTKTNSTGDPIKRTLSESLNRAHK